MKRFLLTQLTPFGRNEIDFVKNTPTPKIKTPVFSIVLYVAAAIIGILAIAGLINNILMFKDAVSHYVLQGYPSATVLEQLIPSQLLPGIFEPVGLYGGIALLILCAGKLNKKLARSLTLLASTATETLIFEPTSQETMDPIDNLDGARSEQDTASATDPVIVSNNTQANAAESTNGR